MDLLHSNLIPNNFPKREPGLDQGTHIKITAAYTLLKSDVTRRDHVSVVMDAGSR